MLDRKDFNDDNSAWTNKSKKIKNKSVVIQKTKDRYREDGDS